MSDHDNAPDPVDKAYLEAEALLNDEAGRAARRARVLAAAAREPAGPQTAAPTERRAEWRRGGWLAAACVAGLGVIVATQVYHPAPRPQQSAPSPTVAAALKPPSPAASSGGMDIEVPPGLSAPPPAKIPAPRAMPIAPHLMAPVEAPSPADIAPPPPPPPPPPPALAITRPPQAFAAKAPAQEVVVTGERRAVGPKASYAAPPFSGADEAAVDGQGAAAPASPPDRYRSFVRPAPDQAAGLRAAAAAGRTAEVKTALAQGVPVDAADADGNTALMKSVHADRVAAAALLRRHGASLDRRNHAGVSARDMAAEVGDAALNQAIGVEP